VRDNPRLNWLLEPGKRGQTAWVVPGKYVLGAPLPPHRPFDLALGIVGESDVSAGQWGMTADPVEMSKNFTEFCPEVRELLSLVDRCVKWTLGEMPPLPTCRSENGRVVLTGDAWHA
jgi:salicylate hydroxylase